MDKDSKRIRAELKKYEIPSADFFDIQNTIMAGKNLLSSRRYQRVNVISRVKSLIKYISPKIWLIQFFLLLLWVCLMNNIAPGADSQLLFSATSFFVALIALIGFPELGKSFSCGMWELEQSCKYNLRQLMSLKMIILGVADLICIALISAVCSGYSALPFWQVGVYLLVPFNVVCICGFLIVSFFRNKADRFNIWVIGGGAAAVFFVICNRLAIYTVDISAWVLGCIVSMAVSGMLIARFLNELKQEDFICN